MPGPIETQAAARAGAEFEGGVFARGLDDASIVATLTALTAASIADAYRRFAPAPIGEAILAGGGARNPTLVRMLRERLHPTTVLLSEDIGLDSDKMGTLDAKQVMKMSQEEFAKLDEKALAKLRGDEVAA